MSQSVQETQYPAKVWAGVASAAIFAVTASAALWLFFAPPSVRVENPDHPPAAVQHLGSVVMNAFGRR